MAAALVTWLQQDQWEVFQEVSAPPGIADVVARKDGILWVIECKLAAGFDVLGQTLRWRGYANKVSAAVPSQDSKRVMAQVCRAMGVGLLTVQQSYGKSSVWVTKECDPPFDGAPSLVQKLAGTLCEEHKTFAAAGTNRGHWTEFKGFARALSEKVCKFPQGISVASLAKDPTLKRYTSEASWRRNVVALSQRKAFPRVRAELRREVWYLLPCAAGEES